jgi:opacity protein-like surface antigen
MRVFREILLFLLVLSSLPISYTKAEWKIQLFLGKSFTLKSDLRLMQPSRQNDLTFHDVKYSDASFKTPLYYGLRVSYFPTGSSHLGLEAEFIHAKIYSDARQRVHVSGVRTGQPIDSTLMLGDIVQGFSMSHGLNFLFFNLVGRVGLFRNELTKAGRVGLYGRAGIGPLIPHSESVIEGEEKAQYELHGPAYQLAAGSEINILENIDLLLEYKYTFANAKGIKIPHGSAETKLKTSHLVFGVGGKF